uniref:Transposase n=1 Tax=Heterorhabditis bacteriophora TaxID=37862 RepID=A0A1I7X3I5_HETBA
MAPYHAVSFAVVRWLNRHSVNRAGKEGLSLKEFIECLS